MGTIREQRAQAILLAHYADNGDDAELGEFASVRPDDIACTPRQFCDALALLIERGDIEAVRIVGSTDRRLRGTP